MRLKNGSKIPSSGLTVVSANPVYIQGDFNTGRKYDGTVNPPSNNSTSDPLTPQVTGYNNPSNPSGTGVRAPCSVLGDAVTILSNSWSDGASGTTPNASSTTVNAALISGIVPTNAYGDGKYSGGAKISRVSSRIGVATNSPTTGRWWSFSRGGNRSRNGSTMAFTARRTGSGISTTISRPSRPQVR